MIEPGIEIAETGTNVFQIYGIQGLKINDLAAIYAKALRSREGRNYSAQDFQDAISFAAEKHREALPGAQAEAATAFSTNLINLTAEIILNGVIIDSSSP